MSLKLVMFDLDGTLLPLNQSAFVGAYFGALSDKVARSGFDARAVMSAIQLGIGRMIANDGSRTNEAVFLEVFSEALGEKTANAALPVFEEFYKNEFQAVKDVCGFAPEAAKTVAYLKDRGVRVVIATNPVFPRIATENRIRWAGLEPCDLELFTTYENSSYSKPNPKYYLDLASRLGVLPEECLMVGNDVREDMVAETVGMSVFLLTDCLLNGEEKDISKYPHGDFAALGDYLGKKI